MMMCENNEKTRLSLHTKHCCAVHKKGTSDFYGGRVYIASCGFMRKKVGELCVMRRLILNHGSIFTIIAETGITVYNRESSRAFHQVP